MAVLKFTTPHPPETVAQQKLRLIHEALSALQAAHADDQPLNDQMRADLRAIEVTANQLERQMQQRRADRGPHGNR